MEDSNKPSTTISISNTSNGAGKKVALEEILPDTHQTRFLITEKTLKDYEDKWCGLLALIDLYGYEQDRSQSVAVEKPRKIKTTQ